MKNKQVLSISHNDLDGIACQILISHTFKHVNYINCSYTNTFETLKQVKTTLHKYDTLIITDLVITDEIYEYLLQITTSHPTLKILWVDHHYESKDYNNNKNLKIKYGEDSSTKLLAQILKITNPQLMDFINSVNAFDIWLENSKYFNDGLKYNTLFWEFGAKSFFSQFKNSQVFTEQHNKVFNKILKDRDNYFADLKDKKLILVDKHITMIFGDKHQNWTQILFKNTFVVQVFSFGKISIKISKNIDEQMCLSVIEKIKQCINNDFLVNIGGHYHIISLTHSGDKEYSIIIDYAKNIYKTLLSFSK